MYNIFINTLKYSVDWMWLHNCTMIVLKYFWNNKKKFYRLMTKADIYQTLDSRLGDFVS